MARHPATEGNELHPSDVHFPDPDGGDGRLSLVNDVAAEFSGLAISSTQPTDMPDGGLWVNLDSDATAVDRLSTYDESTDSFIPIQADSTVVQDSEPAHSKGLIWFDSTPEDGFDMFFSDGKTWYFLQSIREIPDSVSSRPDDNASGGSTSRELGIRFELSQDWGKEIGAELSENAPSELKTARLRRESDFELIDDTDISDLEAGDTFTFDLDEDLEEGTDYLCLVQTDGDAPDHGFFDDPEYPYASDDDVIKITQSGYIDDDDELDTSQGLLYNIKRIGNVGIE